MSVLSSAPAAYDRRDQDTLRGALQQALNDLTRAKAAIRVLQNTPPATTPKATDTVSGTVKVNTPDGGGDPVVYRKPEVDALIAGFTSGITQLTSDVTAGPGSGSQAATIAAGAVTNAKHANMAAHTLKVNITGSAAAPTDSSLSAVLDAELASVQGDIIYRGASSWAALAPGTSGYVLEAKGAAQNPVWAEPNALLYAVSTVVVSPDPFYVWAGRQKQLTAVVSNAAGTNITNNVSVTWTSSDTTVATVSSTGLVTAVKVGTCTVKATAGGVDSNLASCETLVKPTYIYKVGDAYYGNGSTMAGPDDNAYLFYTRTSHAWVVNQSGIIEEVPYNAPPIMYVGGNPYLITQGASTNYCKYSDDLSQWTTVNSPTLTSGQLDPYGTSTAFNVSDTSGSLVSGVKLTLNTMPTNAAKKGVLFCIKKGSVSAAGGSVLSITDTTVSATRLSLTITWSGSTPSISAGTGAFYYQLALANGWWLVWAQTTAITVANNNVIEIDPAGTAAQTGDIYFACAQVEDTVVASTPIPTKGGARVRSADVAPTNIGFQLDVQQPYTLYCRELDMALHSDQADSGNFTIGGGIAAEGGRIFKSGVKSNGFTMAVQSSVQTATAAAAANILFGDVIERRGVADTAHTPTSGISVNAATEVTATGSATTNPYIGELYTASNYQTRGNGQLVYGIDRMLHVHGVLSLAQCRKYFA